MKLPSLCFLIELQCKYSDKNMNFGIKKILNNKIYLFFIWLLNF